MARNFSWTRSLVSPLFSTTRCILETSRLSSQLTVKSDTTVDGGSAKANLISKAMRAYLDRARTYDSYMTEQTAEFDLGRRHLAKIMGKDPENFGQEDIDKAIQYLFPSGLFAPAARPFLRHPSVVFPKKKEAQFGWDGRPFHPFFYTGRPAFNQMLYDGIEHLEHLAAAKPSEEAARDGAEVMKTFVNSTQWKSKEALSSQLIEKITDTDYERFVALGERILEHRFSFLAKKFLTLYREPIGDLVSVRETTEPQVDPVTGVRFSTGSGSRKCSKADVILREGTGVVDINGEDIDFFEGVQERLQILSPFAFLGRVNEFDIEAEVQGPENSFTSNAGALRLAISRALTSFCTPTEVENLRLAGLLTEDPRVRERKIWGQRGARAKFTWKRR